VSTEHAVTKTAEVWGSTWIPGPSPIARFGDDTGYSIAWVRVPDGSMVQVVVDGPAAPAPGTRGDVRSFALDDEAIDVFRPSSGVDR
jgi:hypothetical protein